MIDSETLTNIAVIAVMTAAALFFFHFKSGSFSTTHGLVSTMRAAIEALQIKINIILATLAAVMIVPVVRSWFLNRISQADAAIPALVPPLGPPIRT